MGGGDLPAIQLYVLWLEKFHVDNTRSNDKDTDVVAFTASVGPPPSPLVYPTQIKRMENIQDGDHFVGLEIGPIIAPPHTPVNFGYAIVNSGYDASDTNKARKVMNVLSDVAAGICTGAFGGGGAVWDKLNQLTQGLNTLIFATCDGPVAGDGEFVGTDNLIEWTSNGSFVQQTQSKGTGGAPIPCHGDSNYTVTWSVTRKTDALDLAGVSSDGGMWRAVRQNDGSWQAFSDVKSQVGNPGTFVDVSNAGSLHDELHLCGITADGGIWHTIRHSNGSWQPFGDVTKQSQPGNPGASGAFSRVGIATVFGELQVCGVTPFDGYIWHTIRHLDGTWQSSFGNVKEKTGNPGTFEDVSCAGVVGEFHACGITSDGGIWHTIRHVDGSWQPFGDVKSQAGNPGTFKRVSIAPVFIAPVVNELHVCGVTEDGSLWYTIRHSDGSWTLFGDVKSQAGNPGAFADIGAAGVNGELHLCALDVNGGIWHTIRHADGTWTPFDNVMAEAGNPANFLAVSGTELFSTSTTAVIT